MVLCLGYLTCTWDFNNPHDPINAIPDTTDSDTLIAPSNLQATALSHEKIHLTWEDNSDNEAGFYLEQGTVSDTYDSIFILGPNTTTYTDTNLNSETPYYYVVKAYKVDTSGNDIYSDFTPEVACTTLTDTTTAGMQLNPSIKIATKPKNVPVGMLYVLKEPSLTLKLHAN
jgi:hypothetical protein